MYIIRRNQILIVTLMLMIGVAGYLNAADKKLNNSYLVNEVKDFDYDAERMKSELNNSESDDILSASTTIESSSNNDSETNTGEIEENLGVATLIQNDNSDDEFFIEAKINREQTREERKEWLMDLINTVATSDSTKDNAMTEIISIQDKVEKETAAESLIESKGFGSTYVRIDERGVDVVVGKQTLNQGEVAQIADIIERKTGFGIDKIKISSLKNDVR